MVNNRIIGITLGTVLLGAAAMGCGSGSGGTAAPTPPNGSPASGAAQSAANATHVLPVPSNPIANTSTAPGLEITSAMVENNVDPLTKEALEDRLQVSIKNTTSGPLSDLELFYEMTDTKTKATEGYYQPLTGFTIAPGGTGTVYFDDVGGAGHYPENLYSLYRTSKNEVVFSIEVSAAGYAPATAEAIKEAGVGEKPGE